MRFVGPELRSQPIAHITPRIAATTGTTTASSFNVELLQNMSAWNTAYKQQSKVWTYNNTWWSVVADTDATLLW